MIGILTYHTGYNYGASLQNFALQHVVKKMGLECETINFETDEFVANREMFSHRPKRIKEIIKVITRVPYYSSLKKRQALFDKYTRKCLAISPLYRTEQEVINHASDYDCIICGSDQIWNVSEAAGEAANYIYFLNFPKKQRRVSYAASFGPWVKDAPQHEDKFLPWLKEFDAVGIRETSGVEYVRSLGIDCELNLDPTVLLDKEDYDEICGERIIGEKYILMFGWNTNKNLISAAKKASKELGLPVYNIVPPPRGMFCGIERKLDVGPCEFLSMIKYAEFVVTNSFHGTAFSMTYEKPFVSIVTDKPDLRMKSLLQQLQIENNLVKVADFDVQKALQIDWEKVRENKASLRENSIDYLRRALEVDV